MIEDLNPATRPVRARKSRIQRFANRAKAVDEPAPRARASLGLNFRDERRAGETICHNRSISRAMQESSRNAYRFGQY